MSNTDRLLAAGFAMDPTQPRATAGIVSETVWIGPGGYKVSESEAIAYLDWKYANGISVAYTPEHKSPVQARAHQKR